MSGKFLQFGIIALAIVFTSSKPDKELPIIQELENNLGILIENLGPLSISTTSWNTEHEFDLNPYFTQGDQLKSTWQLLWNKCLQDQSCKEEEKLKSLQNQLERVTKDAKRVEHVLQEKTKGQQIRRKRGLSLAKIFGGLNEEDKKKLEDQIENGKSNIENLYDLIEKLAAKTASNLDLADQKIEQLKNISTLLDQRETKIMNQLMLKSQINLLEDNILQYKFDIILITDAILYERQNTVHFQFLDPELLYNSTLLAKEKNPESVFPSLSEIYRISDISMKYKDKKLIYSLSIPLMGVTNYTLIKAMPMPTRQDDQTFAYYLPALKYFALEDNMETYIPITEDDLGRCKRGNRMYICKDLEPARKVDESAPCEIKLSSGLGIPNATSCDMRMIRLANTLWARASTTNTWMYTTVGDENLQIECEHERRNYSISGTGILYLPTGCTARTSDDERLVAAKEITTVFNPENFVPYYFNFSSILNASSVDEVQIDDIIDKMMSSQKEFPKYQYLESGPSWQQIINEAREGYKERVQSDVQYASMFSEVSVVVGIILVGFVIWKIKSKKGCACFGSRQPASSTIVNISTRDDQPSVLSTRHLGTENKAYI